MTVIKHVALAEKEMCNYHYMSFVNKLQEVFFRK